MRILLLIALLSLSLAGVASAIPPEVACAGCYYPNACVSWCDDGSPNWDPINDRCTGGQTVFCSNVAAHGGVYLAPKPQYQVYFASSREAELRLFSDVDAQRLAGILNETTGWGVDVSGAQMTGPFPAGTYSGTITQIAQQLAAAGQAGVQLNESAHTIIFGYQLME